MDNVCLKVNNLVSTYSNFRISHITFKLNSGDILGLVGRSGSGKSTLIKTLVGLKSYKSGKIAFLFNDNKINYKKVIGRAFSSMKHRRSKNSNLEALSKMVELYVSKSEQDRVYERIGRYIDWDKQGLKNYIGQSSKYHSIFDLKTHERDSGEYLQFQFGRLLTSYDPKVRKAAKKELIRLFAPIIPKKSSINLSELVDSYNVFDKGLNQDLKVYTFEKYLFEKLHEK